MRSRERACSRLALALALAWCALAVGCAPVSGRAPEKPPAASAPRHAEASATTDATAAAQTVEATPVVVGIAGADLVVYDAASGATRTLVPGVNASGPLVVGPDREWIAIERQRRWDGLDTTDIVFANTRTKRVWSLAKQVGSELHIAPLAWEGDTVVYSDSTAFSNVETPTTYSFDLNTGAVSVLSGDSPAENWKPFSEEWQSELAVPNPKVPDGVTLQPGFWAIGAVDVSGDGRQAVAWLQPNWPAPIDEFFPVYLLRADGSYQQLPLKRPAVFAETLGIGY